MIACLEMSNVQRSIEHDMGDDDDHMDFATEMINDPTGRKVVVVTSLVWFLFITWILSGTEHIVIVSFLLTLFILCMALIVKYTTGENLYSLCTEIISNSRSDTTIKKNKNA